MSERTPYIRMDGTRRPSIFAPANAFGGYMDLPGSPELQPIAEPKRPGEKGVKK